MKRLSGLALTLLVIWNGANAYELATHARLTQAAYSRSVLVDQALLQDLGIDASVNNPFGEIYFDVSGSEAYVRSQNDFEKSKMPNNGIDFLSIPGWLMRGAIREDDVPWPFGDNPQDDPYGRFFRVFNHFYDPINNRPLTVGIGLGDIAPQWAIGSSNVFSNRNNPNIYRRNHFTVFDAREAMYRALTGRDVRGNPVAATEAIRNKYWATTFRALGDVVHLLQDMGQPQHTRNDAHSGSQYDGSPGLRGHKSVYENYINARATGAPFSTVGYVGLGTPSISVATKPLTFNSYPTIPAFNNYLDFFTTREADILSRKGLADYSNRGFFSAGTNLGANPYPYPSNSPSSYSTLLNVAQDWEGNPLDYNGYITLILADVPDSVNPSAPKATALTTYSLWDQFLESKGIQPAYTLNRYNYDAMADLLIPRAVAYSAGIINYFFRGKLDVVADPNNLGAYIIKNLGPEDMKGNFTLYYDAVDGKRYPVAGDTPTTTWAAITIPSKGQIDNMTFATPTNPAPKGVGEYMLVFNGDMGEEKAVAGSVGAIAATKTAGPVLYVANPRDFSLGQGVIDEYTGSGKYLKSVPSGLITYQTRLVAAVGNDVYTTGVVNTSFVQFAPPPISQVFKNGVPIATYARATGMAVNSKGVYVMDSDPNNLGGGPADIIHYGFDGAFIGKFSTVGNIGTKQNLSGNENRLLMIDVYTDWLGVLYDLAGNTIATLGPFPTGAYACASARNRHYISVNEYATPTSSVKVYDDSGNFVTSFGVIPGEVWGMAATETKIYVSAPNAGKIIIFDRLVAKDSGGNITSETFQLSSSVDVPGFPMGLAVSPGIGAQ